MNKPQIKDLRWAFNSTFTHYTWRVKGKQARKKTNNPFTAGLEIKYTRREMNPAPTDEAIAEWYPLYFNNHLLIKNAFDLINKEFKNQIKKTSLEKYEAGLKFFSVWLKANHPSIEYLNEITPQMGKAYSIDLHNDGCLSTGHKLSALTVDHRMAMLKSAVNKLDETHEIWTGKLPFMNYKNRDKQESKDKRKRYKYFSETQALWIIENLKEHQGKDTALGRLYHTTMMQWYLGCRISDACCIKTETFNLRANTVIFEPIKTGGLAVIKTLDDEFVKYISGLDSYKNNDVFINTDTALRYVSAKSIEHALTLLDRENDAHLGRDNPNSNVATVLGEFLAKLPKSKGSKEFFKPYGEKIEGRRGRPPLFGTHAFRHGYGFNRALQGDSAFDIMRALCHKDIKMTTKYLDHVEHLEPLAFPSRSYEQQMEQI